MTSAPRIESWARPLRLCSSLTALTVLTLLGAPGCSRASAPESEEPAAPAAEAPAPAPAPAPAAPPAAPSGTQLSANDVTIGERTDGVGVQIVSFEAAAAGTRIRFEFDGVGPVPMTSASLDADGKRLAVVLHGVRRFEADVPLVTGEGGRAINPPRALPSGIVADAGRYFMDDDSAFRLEFALREPAKFSLAQAGDCRCADLTVSAR